MGYIAPVDTRQVVVGYGFLGSGSDIGMGDYRICACVLVEGIWRLAR